MLYTIEKLPRNLAKNLATAICKQDYGSCAPHALRTQHTRFARAPCVCTFLSLIYAKVWIEAAEVAGTGFIRANGGNFACGGRVAVYANVMTLADDHVQVCVWRTRIAKRV